MFRSEATLEPVRGIPGPLPGVLPGAAQPADDVRREGGGRHRAALRSRRATLALVFAALAVVVQVAAGLRTVEPTPRIAVNAVTVILLSLAGLQLVCCLSSNSRGIVWWRTGPWFLLWTALSYGVASLTWVEPQTGVAAEIGTAHVATALTIVAVATVAWTAGYLVGVPRWVRTGCGAGVGLLLRGTRPDLPGAAAPWLLYGIGTLARLTALTLDGRSGYVGDPRGMLSQPSSYGQLLTVLSAGAVFGIAVAAYRAFGTRAAGAKSTLWLLVTAEVVIGALQGGKQSFIVSVLAVLIPYGALRGRLSMRILVIGTLLFLWIAVPFNAAYRELVRSGNDFLTPGEAVAAAPDVLNGVLHPEPTGTAADSTGGTLTGSAWTLLYRIRLVESTAIIEQMSPAVIPYRSPTEFAITPIVALVPRVVWSDKPVLANGYQFSQEYYGRPDTVYTSSALTPIGDLYRHGGLLPVLIGSVLLGGLGRIIDTVFRPERDPRAVLFLLMLIPMIVKSEVDISTMIISLPSAILAAVLAAHVAFRTRPAPA